ncbi:hypothetical protein, partial [Actinoplanes subglobosus]
MTVLSAVPAALIVVILVLSALRLRGRLAALPVIPPSTDTAPDDYQLFAAAGAEVDAATRQAAVAYARGQHLLALDLVPADLPVTETLALARAIDPAGYRDDRMAVGRGAGHALLVSAELAARAAVTPSTGLDPAEMIRLTARLKKYAPTGTDL